MLDSASVNSISSIPSPIPNCLIFCLSNDRLTSIPVQESLAAEHGGELLRDALEQLLDGGGVTDEGGRHLQSTWWNVTDSSLDVVGNPLNKV